MSVGIDNFGKKFVEGKEEAYFAEGVEKLKENDVITVALDLDSDEKTISIFRGDAALGDPIVLPTDALGDNALYPAFSIRNMPFTLITSAPEGEESFSPEGYAWIQVCRNCMLCLH